jgi:outer membrane beta-barrel protein
MKRLLLSLMICAAASSVMAQEMDFTFDAKEVDGEKSAPAEAKSDFSGMDFGAEEVQKSNIKAKKAEVADQQLIRVLQRRPFLRKKRYEFSPEMSSLINDSLVGGVSIGGRVAYHLSEIVAVSIGGAATLSSETALFEQVIEDYAVFPEVSKVLWRANADYQYAFLYGKFALLNRWIIAWDTVASLGLGALQTELAIHPTFTAGIGQRFFMTKWFTVNVGIKDFMYLEDYAAGGELVNHLVVTGGVSFFFPTFFTYRTLR